MAVRYVNIPVTVDVRPTHVRSVWRSLPSSLRWLLTPEIFVRPATFIAFATFPVAVVLSHDFVTLVLAFVVGGLREIGEPARKALIVDLVRPSLRPRPWVAFSGRSPLPSRSGPPEACGHPYGADFPGANALFTGTLLSNIIRGNTATGMTASGDILSFPQGDNAAVDIDLISI